MVTLVVALIKRKMAAFKVLKNITVLRKVYGPTINFLVQRQAIAAFNTSSLLLSGVFSCILYMTNFFNYRPVVLCFMETVCLMLTS